MPTRNLLGLQINIKKKFHPCITSPPSTVFKCFCVNEEGFNYLLRDTGQTSDRNIYTGICHCDHISSCNQQFNGMATI